MSNNLKCKCGYEAKSLAALHGHSKQHRSGRKLPQKKGIFPYLHCEIIFNTQSALNGHSKIHPRIIGNQSRETNRNQNNELSEV